jgi:hypothetical protein
MDTRPVHAVYRSTSHPNLRVIDKDNGGKGDASNAGINAARYPIVCIVDADSVLERTSLRHVVLPLLTEPNTIAAGGCVRIVNGCKVRGGFLEKIGLPRKFLPMAQVVEYLRGFLFGRLGWAPMNAVPHCFRRFRGVPQASRGGGGRIPGRHAGRRHGIDPADAPPQSPRGTSLSHRLPGESRVLDGCAGIAGRAARPANPLATRPRREPGAQPRPALPSARRRGRVDHVPVHGAVRTTGPLVELGGYLFMAAGFAFGFISPAAFWSFMLLAISLGVLLSISALLLEEITCHTYRRPGNLFALTCMAIVENFGYHQLVLFWRLQGLYRWATDAPSKWGEMKRSASLQKDPRMMSGESRRQAS